MPYHQVALELANNFEGFYIIDVSHLENVHVDVLEGLVATLALSAYIGPCIFVSGCELYCPQYFWTILMRLLLSNK